MASPAPKTILAIGAHYDDCVFGVPGILLQAVQQGHRVIILSLIGDYTNWPPAKDRGRELRETSEALAHYHGIEMRFLDYASGRFQPSDETIRATATPIMKPLPRSAKRPCVWRVGPSMQT